MCCKRNNNNIIMHGLFISYIMYISYMNIVCPKFVSKTSVVPVTRRNALWRKRNGMKIYYNNFAIFVLVISIRSRIRPKEGFIHPTRFLTLRRIIDNFTFLCLNLIVLRKKTKGSLYNAIFICRQLYARQTNQNNWVPTFVIAHCVIVRYFITLVIAYFFMVTIR